MIHARQPSMRLCDIILQWLFVDVGPKIRGQTQRTYRPRKLDRYL